MTMLSETKILLSDRNFFQFFARDMSEFQTCMLKLPSVEIAVECLFQKHDRITRAGFQPPPCPSRSPSQDVPTMQSHHRHFVAKYNLAREGYQTSNFNYTKTIESVV